MIQREIIGYLTAVRKEKKISLKAMVDLSGLSFSTIQMFERNQTSPRLCSVIKYMKALNVTLTQVDESIRESANGKGSIRSEKV
jgi:transcriptional regulator with XRE-family HTH domain